MRVGIVGGGVGGMITGLLLLEKGYDVTIFEKSDRLGGRLRYVEHEGYRIDQGPTIVLLPDMLRDILQAAGVSIDQYSLQACDPLYSIQFADGNTFTKRANLDEQLAEIERVFPGQSNGFSRFMKDMEQRFSIGHPAFLKKQFIRKSDFWTTKNLKAMLKLKAYQTADQFLKSYFDNEQLRLAYSLQTLYIGGNPYATPAMYNLISYSEHAHGIYYVKGGYASLVKVLHDTLEAKGAIIYTKTQVDEVVVEGDVATGVVSDNRLYEFDSVILNGDFPIASKLLKKRSGSERKFTPSSGCLLLYMGIDKVYKDNNVHQFFLPDNFEQTMTDIFIKKQIPENPSFYTFHPSIIDDSLAPAGKGVMYMLVPVPSGDHIDWESQKDRLVDQILQEAETKGFPGLRGAIEWLEVRTPQDSARDGLFAGGSFGIAPTLFQSGVFRPQVKPYDIDNLFAVGASIHPGGGIPIVMQGAMLCAEEASKYSQSIQQQYAEISR
ncbi:phytoene desaturase [Bacillus sp. HMF5848]|uniref:phytoene desaturase family protein n=1 Tax=Bacillus sp. HMF5848 TaxID=2495421 RepID=UPI000F7BAA12|nr:phytoene desaturase family protein [Bacillus sp. HMF5848]RSK26388.1 phytoene desaturase [Bacillus sp. HMF5848]